MISPASPNHAGDEGPATASAVVNGGASSMPAEGPSPVPFYAQGYVDSLRAIEFGLRTSSREYDVARAMAKHHPGGLERLAGKMTARARMIELVRAEMARPVAASPEYEQLDLLGGVV